MIKVNAIKEFRITKITTCQFVIIGILVIIFVQILLNESYDSLLSVALIKCERELAIKLNYWTLSVKSMSGGSLFLRLTYFKNDGYKDLTHTCSPLPPVNPCLN